MKYLYLFVSLLFISLSSSAQSNYKPGYVVDLKNDTLKGYIDYKEWENNPKSFTFKSNLNQSQPQKFSIDNTNAFAITGAEYFQKFIFTKSTSITNINKLQIAIDTNRVRDTGFMKRIEDGKNVSLYSFTDNIKTRFYTISNKDHEPIELNYYVFYLIDNNVAAQTLYTFRGELALIAKNFNVNNPKLDEKIKYAYYKENDLRAIVRLINGESLSNFKQASVSGTRFFAGAGIRSSKLSTGGGATFFPEGTNRNSTSPIISAGMDFFLNKYTQKLVFRGEVDLSSDHYNIPPTVVNAMGTTASLDFKQYTASVMPQVIYNVYSRDKFKLFIDAGVALNFSSYNKYSYILNFSDVSTISRDGYPGFEKFWVAFPVKAGVALGNKIEIYASHTFFSSITQINAAAATISYYQAGINYLF